MLEFFDKKHLELLALEAYAVEPEPAEVELDEDEDEINNDFVGGITCKGDQINLVCSWDKALEDEQFAGKLGLWLYLLTSGVLRAQFIELLRAEMLRNPEFIAAVAMSYDKNRNEIENLPEVSSTDVFKD